MTISEIKAQYWNKIPALAVDFTYEAFGTEFIIEDGRITDMIEVSNENTRQGRS